MILTLSLISIFSPFIPILTGFLGLNTREPQRHIFRSGSISVRQLTDIQSDANGIMQAFNVEDIHGEDT